MAALLANALWQMKDGVQCVKGVLAELTGLTYLQICG